MLKLFINKLIDRINTLISEEISSSSLVRDEAYLYNLQKNYIGFKNA